MLRVVLLIIIDLVIHILFETEYHVAEVDLELSMYPRMILNF